MTAFDREWTPEEEEALDEISRNLQGSFNGTVEYMITNIGNGIFCGSSNMSSPSTPITLNDLQEMYEKVQVLMKEKGIYLTHIVPPEQGWPIGIYCPICKVTTFLHSPYAVQPKEGGLLVLRDICAEAGPTGMEHMMEMCFPNREWKSPESTIQWLPPYMRVFSQG